MMHELTEMETHEVDGGLTGWQFLGAMFAIGGATIAVCTAPAWGAAAGVLAIAGIGANAISTYANP